MKKNANVSFILMLCLVCESTLRSAAVFRAAHDSTKAVKAWMTDLKKS